MHIEVCVHWADTMGDEFEVLDAELLTLEHEQSTREKSHHQPLSLIPDLFEDIQSIPWEDWFATWLTALAPDYSPMNAYELTLKLTTDRIIQQFNADYRDRDYATDVLAFATLDLDYQLPDIFYASQPYYLGDLIISLETAHRQANDVQHPFITELAWLSAHGFLHLLGWDHPNEERLKSMLDKQRTLLSLINVVQ